MKTDSQKVGDVYRWLQINWGWNRKRFLAVRLILGGVEFPNLELAMKFFVNSI